MTVRSSDRPSSTWSWLGRPDGWHRATPPGDIPPPVEVLGSTEELWRWLSNNRPIDNGPAFTGDHECVAALQGARAIIAVEQAPDDVP